MPSVNAYTSAALKNNYRASQNLNGKNISASLNSKPAVSFQGANIASGKSAVKVKFFKKLGDSLHKNIAACNSAIKVKFVKLGNSLHKIMKNLIGRPLFRDPYSSLKRNPKRTQKLIKGRFKQGWKKDEIDQMILNHVYSRHKENIIPAKAKNLFLDN